MRRYLWTVAKSKSPKICHAQNLYRKIEEQSEEIKAWDLRKMHRCISFGDFTVKTCCVKVKIKIRFTSLVVTVTGIIILFT